MAKQECVLKFKEGSQEPRKVSIDGIESGGGLPEGGNNGDILTKDSSVASGAKWSAPQGGGVVVNFELELVGEDTYSVVADMTPSEVYNLKISFKHVIAHVTFGALLNDYYEIHLGLAVDDANQIFVAAYAMNSGEDTVTLMPMISAKPTDENWHVNL